MAARPPIDDFLLFNEELAALARTRLPLPEGIRHMAKQVRSRSFRKALLVIENDLREGRSLSEAVGRHERLFSPMYVHAVRAGEESGNLVAVLDELAAYLASVERMKQRIKGAAAYPLTTLVVFFAALCWVLWFVVPRFIDFWGQAGAELPAPTQVLVALSRLLTVHPLMPLVVVLVGVLVFRSFLVLGPLSEVWGATVMFLPVVGRIVRHLDLARFSLAMGHLLSCRVPLVDALALTAGTLRNGYAREAARRLMELVSEGRSLSHAMERQYFFPDFYYWAIGEGERREDLGRTLTDLGRHYQRWSEERLMNLGLLMEPLLLILIGITVAFVVCALYLPLFRIGDIIR